MAYTHLQLTDREQINLLLNAGYSIRKIARQIHRNPSTISREIHRNSPNPKEDNEPEYCCYQAENKYQERLHRQEKGKFNNQKLRNYVMEKLENHWSPEQISGRIKKDFPKNLTMRISHNTIYKWIKRGYAERINKKVLRYKGRRWGIHKPRFSGAKHLRERCLEAKNRQRLGDWEMDTIVSGRQSPPGLLSICDRKSRFCVLAFMRNSKNTDRVFETLKMMQKNMLILTVTTDRGVEFTGYKRIENELRIPVYFCSPSSPWQKGSVENMNSLIREFFPKGTNFQNVSLAEIEAVAYALNSRPRKCLGWYTPTEVFLKNIK